MKKYFLVIFILIFSHLSFANEEISTDKNNLKNILSSMVSVKALKTDTSLNKDTDKFLYTEDNYVFSTGSGFLIDKNGTIVTNYHVISDFDKIIITTNDNKEFLCDVVGYDKVSDIAVVKAKTKDTFENYIDLNININYEVGDEVFVVGNPYNIGMSISSGIISGLNRVLQNGDDNFYIDLIQTDAAINKGNSGGALFKKTGEFIGMTSVIFSPNGTNIGIGFAINVKDIVDIVDKINNFGYVQRGWIGIEKGENIHENELKILNLKKNHGVIITNIQKDSPADLGGLKISDIIISYNDNQIKNFYELITLIRNTSVNSIANIVVYRKNELKTLNINVKEYSDIKIDTVKDNYIKSNTITIFNSYVIPINSYVSKLFDIKEKNGFYILKPSSILEKNGVESGNIILSINQNNIENESDANKIIQNIKDNKSYLVVIKTKEGNKLFVLNNDK